MCICTSEGLFTVSEILSFFDVWATEDDFQILSDFNRESPALSPPKLLHQADEYKLLKTASWVSVGKLVISSVAQNCRKTEGRT